MDCSKKALPATATIDDLQLTQFLAIFLINHK